jgi:hypothetical protein
MSLDIRMKITVFFIRVDILLQASENYFLQGKKLIL